MKKTISIIIVLLISISNFAQQGINYKALIKDTNGNVLANTSMTVQFTIHQSTSNGTIVYQEDHNYTTDTNGLIVLNIGTDTTPLLGNFDDIDWSADQHFLQTSISYSGGTINFNATEFTAVPYAKHATTAENVTGLEQITESGNTGWRLKGWDSSSYGNIGNNAVDLSISNSVPANRGATGAYSTAMGRNTIAIADFSTAMGYYAEASGISSTAMGYNTSSSGDFSIAMGYNVETLSFAEIAIGVNNTSYTPNSTETWHDDDRLFAIGNGVLYSGNKSDALIVLKNGTITAPSFDLAEIIDNKALITKEYGDTNYLLASDNVDLGGSLTIKNESDANSSWRLETRPNGNLSMYRNGSYRGFFSESTGNYSSISDRSTKKDIIPLNNKTLDKVMQLNPVSYLMKDQTDNKRNLGLISQEVEKLFPSVTHYVKGSDLLSLSYTELIPIIIKAIQEQQEIIETQNKNIEKLIQRIEILEKK